MVAQVQGESNSKLLDITNTNIFEPGNISTRFVAPKLIILFTALGLLKNLGAITKVIFPIKPYLLSAGIR